MAYQLEGRILEVCTCDILCPCWVGEDPDTGICESVEGYRVDQGAVDGVDVSGLTIGVLSHIPGNILEGNFRVVFFIDDKATAAQQEALLNVWTGKLGGPLAEVAQLFGEVVAVERVPISFDVVEGKGHLRIGEVVDTELAPYRGPNGEPTKLVDTPFSTIPGSPAYAGKAAYYRVNAPKYGFNISVENHNAIQGHFRFEA
jgi:hypothetical protein